MPLDRAFHPDVTRERVQHIQPEQYHTIGDLITDAAKFLQRCASVFLRAARQRIEIERPFGDCTGCGNDIRSPIAAAQRRKASLVERREFLRGRKCEIFVAIKQEPVAECLTKSGDYLFYSRNVIALRYNKRAQHFPPVLL